MSSRFSKQELRAINIAIGFLLAGETDQWDDGILLPAQTALNKVQAILYPAKGKADEKI